MRTTLRANGRTILSRALALASIAAVFQVVASAQLDIRYFYDDANQLVRALDGSGTLLEYIYDPAGNLSEVRRSTVAPGAISILYISPLSAGAGQTVTIYGQNFSSTPANNVVRIGGVQATVVSATPNQLVIVIPAGAASGAVSVTVGGTTVSSGTLQFALGAPSISSVVPDGGPAGRLVPVTINGTNLTGAAFDLAGGGAITTLNSSATSANVEIVGAFAGDFPVVASNATSSSVPDLSASNRFRVLPVSGDWMIRVSVLNTALGPGGLPPIAAGSNAATATVSVLNMVLGPNGLPPISAGSNAAFHIVSTLNTTLGAGGLPPIAGGGNFAFDGVSVLNTVIAPGGLAPATTNEAFSIAAVRNNSSPPPPSNSPAFPVSSRRPPVGPISSPLGAPISLEIVWPGQTFTVNLGPGPLSVNGFSITGEAPAEQPLLFTVPASAETIELRVADRDPVRLKVAKDPGAKLSGRIIDAEGRAVPSARVVATPAGWIADFYSFATPLAQIPVWPEAPLRRQFLTAVNLRNPEGVFSRDPFAIGAERNTAMRVRSRLHVETAGTYRWILRAHERARFSIDGKRVIESGFSAATPAETFLDVGWHDLEVAQFESEGIPVLQLLWQPPGAGWSIVPPEAVRIPAPVMTSVSDENGNFAFVGLTSAMERIDIEAFTADLAGSTRAVVQGSQVEIVLALKGARR